MNKIKFVLLFSILPIGCILAQDTTCVLFLGNSYTYTNELPLLWAELSGSAGKTAVYDYNAPGGYWLEDHCSNSISTGKIMQGGWDWVILQEQSQVPTIDTFRYNSMYPSAEWLDSLIMLAGGNTMLFMTWGREFGGQQWISGYSSPPFANFFEMQDSLAAAYNELGAILNAPVAPVGLAWEQAVTMNPTVDLWQDDHSHPTLEGSYLAACVFFGTVFAESPVGLTYTAGLSPERAAFLQEAAYLTLGMAENPADGIPAEFAVMTVFPNPFNGSAVISFELKAESEVELKIYDVGGREIQRLEAGGWGLGKHSVVWDAEGMGSGVYFVRLTVDGGQSKVKKVVVVK